MTEHKTKIVEKLENNKFVDSDVFGGRVRLYRGELDLSEVTVEDGDTVILLKEPSGGNVISRRLNINVSLGTAKISVGTEEDDDVYRTSAVKTDCLPEELKTNGSQMGGYVILTADGDLPTEGIIIYDTLVADI